MGLLVRCRAVQTDSRAKKHLSVVNDTVQTDHGELERGRQSMRFRENGVIGGTYPARFP
jgi:hypothetical protein